MRMTKLCASLFLLMTLSAVACGKNPAAPLPPIVNPSSFQELIDILKTPKHVETWLSAFGRYDARYNFGWWDWQGKAPDQACRLAESLWTEHHGGKNRGVCGQFAALYVVAARAHGYRCGGLLFYDPGVGHALGWIEETDGSITISDNMELWKSRLPNYEALRKLAKQHTRYELLNDRFERIEVGP